MKSRPHMFSPGAILRVIADGILINISLALALTLRFVMLVGGVSTATAGRSPNAETLLDTFVAAYLHNAIPLTALVIAVYFSLGFYTYGIWYHGRLKPLLVIKSTLLAYALFAFFTYMTADSTGQEEIPRGSLILSAALTVCFCGGARLCSYLWERIVEPEKKNALQALPRDSKHILVIGGAGYIGSALLPKLLKSGKKVRILDRFLYGREPIASYISSPDVELYEGDFRDTLVVMKAMSGIDTVIHLGAIVGDPGCNLDEKVTKTVNLIATKNIAEIARECGVRRFIFASTCSVYGATDQTLDETSEVVPVSLYGRTKLVAEEGLLKMATNTFSPVILRFATIYGLSGRTRFDLVVNLLTAMAKTEGRITVHGGDQWRPFVHVDDAALAVSKMVDAPLSKVAGQIFNVGSDEQNATIQQIGELIAQHVPGAQLIINNDTTDKRNYRVSFKKIRQSIGFTPQWTLDGGVIQVLEAVASGAVGDFKDAKYSNVRFLSERNIIQLLRVDDDWSQRLQQIEGTPEVAPLNGPHVDLSRDGKKKAAATVAGNR